MNQVQQIQIDINKLSSMVKLGQTFDRLRSNPDFKAVIEDLYFRDESIRLVSAKANPGCQNPATQAAIIRDIDAIGSLQQFFDGLVRMADQAASQLEQAQQELLQAEQDEDDEDTTNGDA